MFMFNSLLPLFEIIKNEKFYQIQLLTTEPYQIVVDIFYRLGFKCRVFFSSLYGIHDKSKFIVKYKKRYINIVLNDDARDMANRDLAESFILIGGEIVPNLTHIIFMASKSETLEYMIETHIVGGTLEKSLNVLKKDSNRATESTKRAVSNDDISSKKAQINLLVKKHFKFYTISQLNEEINRKEKTCYCLDNLESTIILTLCSHTRFWDIVENVKKIETTEDNSFRIILCINRLIKYGFIKRIRKNYKLNISEEAVNEICKRIGYNTQQMTAINK